MRLAEAGGAVGSGTLLVAGRGLVQHGDLFVGEVAALGGGEADDHGAGGKLSSFTHEGAGGNK